MDQQKTAPRRQYLLWSALSYVPLIAGIAWFVFAWNRWSGRGQLLAVSGLMVCLAGTSALSYPALRRLVPPTRRILGLSLSNYISLSVAAAILIAAVLAVVAFVIPLR